MQASGEETPKPSPGGGAEDVTAAVKKGGVVLPDVYHRARR